MTDSLRILALQSSPYCSFPQKSFLGLFAIIIALIGVAYWGIDARLKSLEDHFQTAIVSSADVKHLLNETPNLKQTINETHDAVIRLQDSSSQVKEQLNSMQSQIHQIPIRK